VFGLARDRAGVAADAFPVIDYEAEVHKASWKDCRLIPRAGREWKICHRAHRGFFRVFRVFRGLDLVVNDEVR
jgi:hypothetical protein